MNYLAFNAGYQSHRRKPGMGRKSWTLLFLSFFMGCSISPKPASLEERYTRAREDIAAIYDSQEKLGTRIDFYEAMARGLKYNLDYRIKLANTALQMGQLRVAT